MNPSEVREWVNTIQALVVPVLGYLAYVLRSILTELRTMNSRIIKLEQWQLDHTVDDERRLHRLERMVLEVPKLRSEP